MTPVLIKSFAALTAVAPYSIIRAAVDGIETAATDIDALIGVADSMGAPIGGMLDAVQVGWGEVLAGGTFAFGDPLTSDAQGRAIKAEASAGKVVRVVGIAMQDADAGDIVPLLVSPSCIALA